MTDDPPPAPRRRRLLGALGASVVTGLAGCNVEEGPYDDERPASGETDAGEDDEQTDDPGDDAGVGASFDFAARRNPFFDAHEEFETFRISFQGFELRPVDGEPVRVEADGPEFDLTGLSDDDPLDLVEAQVPPGTYTELAVHLPVVEATLVEGGSATVADADPRVLEVGTDGYDVDPETSVAFTLLLAVRRTDAAWTYELGYETY